MIPGFSVLMSVYFKENPIWLKESIESVLHNTVIPSQIVIVKDGPLPQEIEDVLLNYSKDPRFTIVGYEKNLGLGKALDFGLDYCRNDLVARMDTDDLCCKKRFEKQLTVFEENEELTIVGSIISEFIDEPTNIVGYRVVPEKQEGIINYCKKRNPFNHPSVMFKKSSVVDLGGYIDFYRNEDYYLWYRLLKNGCLGFNIQEPLINMRVSKDFYKRRGGFKAYRSRLKLNRIMKKDRFISVSDFIFVWFANTANLLMPSFIRGFVHKRFLRKQR